MTFSMFICRVKMCGGTPLASSSTSGGNGTIRRSGEEQGWRGYRDIDRGISCRTRRSSESSRKGGVGDRVGERRGERREGPRQWRGEAAAQEQPSLPAANAAAELHRREHPRRGEGQRQPHPLRRCDPFAQHHCGQDDGPGGVHRGQDRHDAQVAGTQGQ